VQNVVAAQLVAICDNARMQVMVSMCARAFIFGYNTYACCTPKVNESLCIIAFDLMYAHK